MSVTILHKCTSDLHSLDNHNGRPITKFCPNPQFLRVGYFAEVGKAQLEAQSATPQPPQLLKFSSDFIPLFFHVHNHHVRFLNKFNLSQLSKFTWWQVCKCYYTVGYCAAGNNCILLILAKIAWPCKQNASGKTSQTTFLCQSKWKKTSWTCG